MRYILTQQSAEDLAEIKESINEMTEVISSLQEISYAFPAVCVFIVSYFPTFFLVKAINNSRKQKIEKAKELGQVVEAKLCGKKRRRIRINKKSNYSYAKYSYVIDRKERKKTICVYTPGRYAGFKEYINIYYLGGKIYTNYDQPKKYMLFIYLLPFFIGAFVLYITNPDMF